MDLEKKFYVYEWFNINTNEVFYVGKGCKKRYKDMTNRNQYFLDYVRDNQVDSRIVKYFKNEDEAFAYEKELTLYYKSKGQCQCSLLDGGYGGYSKVWTDEMKKYWSEYNPMKNKTQRQRMKDNNPMKNKEYAMKSGAKHKRAVVINNIQYDGVIDASKILNVSTDTIITWCKKGINPSHQPCRYADEEQKIVEEVIISKSSWKQVQIDDKIYNSISEAARAIDINQSNLSRALKSGKTEYHGHKINYANQQPS